MGQVAGFKTAEIQVDQGILKQRVIIRLEPDFGSGPEKGAILQKLARMGQTALGMLGMLRPGIAEMDIKPIRRVFRSEDSVNKTDILLQEKEIIRLAFAGLNHISPGDAQNVRAQIRGDEIDDGLIRGHGGGTDALAAAHLQMKRPIRKRETRTPAVFPDRAVLCKKRTGGQLRPGPFLLTHVHEENITIRLRCFGGGKPHQILF